ncbi:unnamed protein product [Allacma fusca]|uniref:Uncharacterized protein n=1 Tax=Allacma fusca TaxID=39272 RepID=A0A8J2PWN4_9HEXA|nr:unnamed protein product [Allacma fusca]
MLTWSPKSYLLLYCFVVLMVSLHPTSSTPINETALKTNESVKAWRPGSLFSRPAPVTASYQVPMLIFIPQMPSAGQATGFISFQDTLPAEHSKNFMSVLPVVHDAPIPYPTVYPNKPVPTTENFEPVLLTESLPPESPVSSQSSKPDDDYELYEELLSPEDIVQDPLPPSLAFEEEIPKKVNNY